MRVTTTDLQNAFGKYLALTEKEDIIVVKNGKSVAKLVKYKEPDFYVVQEETKGYQSARRITYEEYLELVNSSDQRYELIDGTVYLLASPGFRHQAAVYEISGNFFNYFKGKPCQALTAPFDVRLHGFATKFEEDPNVVQPDVLVICDQDKVVDNKYHGVPTLVVEVLSPYTRGKDLAIKLNLYMKSGVQEFWVVDPEKETVVLYNFTPEREFEEQRFFKTGEVVVSLAFPGLELPVADIFA
jgi:prevent-host-death family protein